jgi:acyl-CoA synthetase (AMP-forming)/AMP-acid ligase II
MPRSLDPVIGVLDRIPLRVRDTTLIAAPLFHGWGFANLGFSMLLSASVVLQDRFDPEAALAAVARHRVRVLVAVPVMLQRILDLPEEVRARYDTSSLEVVAVSGSALAGGLATQFMDAFGDVLYNLYGSTEAAWASIATPADLREAPQSAGRPPFGTELRIVDDEGAPVPAGTTGHIHVRNAMLHGAPQAGGFLDTGDVGHVGEDGRLYVEGRSDDMIVSGGENVYPQEVEELLATHPAIAEAAVMGVPDERFGQRLKALVVLRDGESVSADEVRSYVRGRLARYKVPRDVEMVDSLPRNATGKVLRKPPTES